MADFTTAMLPTGIYACTTVEELNAWCNLVLANGNPTDSYIETANTNRIFRFINPEFRIPDGPLMKVFRSALQINEAAPQNMPTWKRVSEFSEIVVPASFRLAG